MKTLTKPVVRLEGRSQRSHPVLDLLRGGLRVGRGRVGLALVVLVVLVAALGPTLAPHDPGAFVTSPFAPPSGTAPLGGDDLGRDVLSRLLAGGWVLLIMAAAATVVGIVAGAASGISAAYLRGYADGAIMRSVDVMLAFPQIVLALLFVAVFGSKLWLIVLVVGASQAPQTARVLRSAALDIAERDYVKAAEAIGISRTRIMFSVIVPNLLPPLMVEIGLRLTYSIIIIAGMAYLGFGQAPPAPSWGIMVQENSVGLSINPWGVVAPTILIALLTIGANLFTDSIAMAGHGGRGSDENLLAELGALPGPKADQ
jgi:peptide/nickel transport system permease protein